MLALVLLLGCSLESVGAYSCDQYCGGIQDKAEQCASDQGVTFDDFAGVDEQTAMRGCQDYVDSEGGDEARCRTETAAINNSSCEDIAAKIQRFTGS